MNDTRKNWVVLLGSLVVFFLLLEGGLRLAGMVFMLRQEQRNRQALQAPDAVRILCLGESTTALGGEYSYPRQLENILNRKSGGKKFKVINKGVPGITTDEIVSGLTAALDKYSPHIVITMMGVNDDEEDAKSWEESVLNASRVFRLFRLIGLHVAEKLPFTRAAKEKAVFDQFMEGWEKGIGGDPHHAQDMFQKQLAQNPEDPLAYVELASWYLVAGEFSRALEILDKAEAKFPGQEDIALERATAYLVQGQWARAETALYTFVQQEDYNDDAFLGLGWAFMQQGKYQQAEAILEQNVRMNPRDVSYGALILCYEKQGKTVMAEKFRREAELRRVKTLLPMTVENYQETYRRVHDRGIPLIAVQYPRRNVALLRGIFQPKDRVIYVDNESLFNEAVQRDGYDTYFINNFAGDFGHATPKGNALLAENVAAAVRQLLTTF